jgi:hypothetical protein
LIGADDPTLGIAIILHSTVLDPLLDS